MVTVTGTVRVGGQTIPVTADLTLPGAASRGVWVLQQFETIATLRAFGPTLADIMATVPAVTGFCVRMGWRQLLAAGGINVVLNASKALAETNGLELAFRPMAGRHTPAATLTGMGNDYTATNTAGEAWPLPFSRAGTAGNPVFEQAYAALAHDVAAWYAANGSTLLHHSWFAMDWAELNHGKEVRAVPGYTQARWLEGHKRLVTAVASATEGMGVVNEWPLSGYGPLTEVSPQLADHMVSLFAEPECSIQGNGWSFEDQWGAATPAVRVLMDKCWERPLTHGLQAIQPWGGTNQPQYTAAQVTAALGQATEVDAAYVEIYAPSLRASTGGAVWAQPLAAWSAT